MDADRIKEAGGNRLIVFQISSFTATGFLIKTYLEQLEWYSVCVCVRACVYVYKYVCTMCTHCVCVCDLDVGTQHSIQNHLDLYTSTMDLK